MKRWGGLVLVAGLLTVLFILFNLLAAWLGGSGLIDATSARRYTLSATAQAAVDRLPQPVTMRLYVSEDLADWDWNFGAYAAETAALLSKYRLLAPDKIKLQVYRVASSTATEKQALRDGIMPLNGEEKDYYFGLHLITADGKSAVIPSLRPERRTSLENDLNRILINLGAGKAVVGVVSPQMPLFAETGKTQLRALPVWLGEYFKLSEIPATSSYISPEVAVLLVINPGQMSTLLGYAVDQYVMRGGKVVFFVDPYSEMQHSRQGYPPRPDHKMESFLKEWGIVYQADNIVGDLPRGEKVKDDHGRSRVYPLWFFADGFGSAHLHFRTPGSLSPADNTDLQYQVLASTGNQGGEIPVSEVRYTPKSQVILTYRQDNRSRVLALMARGQFRSHYRDNVLAATASADKAAPYIPFSDPGAAVAVVADSDFVSDAAWAADYNPDNPVYGTLAYAENADFVVRLIEHMIGRAPLIPTAVKPASANLAEIFYAGSYQHFGEERERLEAAEADSAARVYRLLQKNAGPEDIGYRRELEQARQDNRRNAQALQQLNSRMTAAADQALYRFAALNLIVFPSVLLGAIALAVYLLRRFRRRKRLKCGDKK